MVKFQTEAVKRHWVVVSVLHFTAVEKPNTVEATPQLQIIKDSGKYVKSLGGRLIGLILKKLCIADFVLLLATVWMRGAKT